MPPFLEILRDMTPGLSLNNGTYLATRNIEFSRQSALVCFALCVAPSNFYNLGFGEFGPWGLFPAHLTALLYFVGIVVLDSAKEQVRRIHAAAIVASVANKQLIGKLAKVQTVREAMGNLLMFARKSKRAIPVVCGQFPIPTGIRSRFFDMFPKSRLDGTRTKVGMMPRQKVQWLAFPYSILAACSSGDWSWLTAAAFAKFNGGVLRGMIHDVTSSFKLLTMPRDTRNVAVALLLVDFIIPKEVRLCHS